jgi:hypothetical protein
MGTIVEELLKKLVKRLVDEKYGQKFLEIQLLTKAGLPRYVGRLAILCRESCHAM